MDYMIVDDDRDSRIVLSLLVRQNYLANLVLELEGEENVVDDILFYRPDVLLIDLMQPDKKGLDIIKEAVGKGYRGKIIVVSEVTDDDTISQMYGNGILFFIKKPVNTVEVISVLKNTNKIIDMERSISEIKKILLHSQTEEEPALGKGGTGDIGESLYEIFSEIGIVGLSGTEEILEVLKYIYNIQKKDHKNTYRLKDVYQAVCIKLYGEENRNVVQKNMEQRIRRTIQKALGNIAEMGCEDYYDSVFAKYSNVLFDFKQVRQEMQHIKNPKAYSGKINTKKFMEGILSKVD